MAVLVAPAWAQLAPGGLAVIDGAFSRAQAQRGAQLFGSYCASCHTSAQASQLMLDRGGGQTIAAFTERLSAIMPPMGEADRPSAQGYLDIVAHLSRTGGAVVAEVAAPGQRTLRLPVRVKLAAAAATPQTDDLAWLNWRGDIGGTAYSSAAQIDKSNAAKLEIAWAWSSASFGQLPDQRSITTPLMADGVVYISAGSTRDVVALDAATGETLWLWRPQEAPARYDNAPRKGAGRGVAYWRSGAEARIFTVTPGFHLAALDARTGRPVESFGDHGQVDLMQGLRGLPESGFADIGSSSPPLIVGDVAVVGPAHLPGMRPKSRANVKGDVRGYDVRTGALLWTFHTIPAPGEPGYETWLKGSAEYTGNTGVWAPMSADLSAGAIFLPVESATGDRYGGERPGNNLYSDSLVSLDAKTGKVRWSQQLIHHDIWDWDNPAMPILGEVKQGKTTRRIVAQITKQAFLFVFDRDTGKPIWPIIERKVPGTMTPDEVVSPTQPMPTRPLPFDRQGVSEKDLIDFTPELHAEALTAVKPYKLGELFTPPAISSDELRGVLTTPSPVGGGNWEGGAFDPETGVIYVASMTQATNLSLVPAGSDVGLYSGDNNRAPTVRGLPILKPPYGRITAIDLNTGEHVWMKANGATPGYIRNNPALAGLSIPPTGKPTRAGLLATKTLLFAGEGVGGDPLLHILDKATGATIADIALPGAQSGMPMSYVWKGRQYVAMSVSDGVAPSQIVALALPN
jgi:glucose dehydrogenase